MGHSLSFFKLSMLDKDVLKAKIKMQTRVRDWYVIKVFDDKNVRVGQLLWGFIVDDPTERFSPGDYVCTSSIEAVSKNVIVTAKGSQYVTEGTGKEFDALFSEIELLRRGYSPTQVYRLRNSK
jgi:hypothetical protein